MSNVPPVVQNTTDTLQTLVRVNNLDQSLYVDKDTEIISKHWNKVFLQNTVSEDIYDAVASKSGTSAATRKTIAWTKIPYDFILDKANLSQSELQHRFAYAQGNKIFDKEENGTQTNAAVEEDGTAQPPLEQFGGRMKSLRELIMYMAQPRLRALFRNRAGQVCGEDYPNCKDLEDYLLEYRTGTYDNKKRAMVNKLCNHAWGKACSGSIEKAILTKLKIEYTNEVLKGCTNGKLVTTPKTRRVYGSVKKMIQRLKQTYFIDRFRTIGLEVHREVIYHREVSKPTKGIVRLIKVAQKDFGFDGYLGLASGNPLLLTMDIASTVKEKQDDNSQASLLAYLQEKAPDILACWTRSQNTGKVISVSTDETTVMSAVTNNSVSSPVTKESVTSPPKQPEAPRKESTPLPSTRATNIVTDKKSSSKAKRKKPSGETVSTPKKKQKESSGNVPPKVSNLPPDVRSPDRMENGLYCKGCDHGKAYEPYYVPYERNWFTKARLSLPNHPTNCAECKKSFLPCPKGGKQDEYAIIGGMHRVQACRNAVNHRDHPCVHALCSSCFMQHPGNASPLVKNRRDVGRRSRKQTRLNL